MFCAEAKKLGSQDGGSEESQEEVAGDAGVPKVLVVWVFFHNLVLQVAENGS